MTQRETDAGLRLVRRLNHTADRFEMLTLNSAYIYIYSTLPRPVYQPASLICCSVSFYITATMPSVITVYIKITN